MDTKKLRQKILDLAIRGKLVPQDPNDEPASVLLERIRAEKERLIAEGKIKRPKKSKASSSESHYQKFTPPFDIPDSWEWVRLEDIANIGTGATPSRGNKKYYGGNINWVSSSVTSKRYVYEPTDHITDLAIKETNCVIYPIGTLIMAMYGEGKTRGQLTELKIEAATNQACAAVQPLNIETKEFIKLYLLANYYHLRQLAEGGNQPNLNIGKICGLYLPFPPLKEQSRIVNEYSKFDKVINSIDNNQCVLLDIIANTKSKILELAMQGKLVPQDPTDEPAVEMLKRINPNAKIITDNPHYPNKTYPHSWCLASIEDINSYKSETINPSNYPNSIFDVYSVPTYSTGKPEKLTGKDIRSTKQSVRKGDILLCKINPHLNRVWLIEESYEIPQIASSEWIVIRSNDLYMPFLKFYLESPEFRKLLCSQVSGVGGSLTRAQPATVKKYHVPIPPYREQQSIVKMIDEIFSILDNIRDSLQN